MPLRQLVSFLTRPTQAPRRSGRITAKLHTRTRLGPSRSPAIIRSPANHCRGPPLEDPASRRSPSAPGHGRFAAGRLNAVAIAAVSVACLPQAHARTHCMPSQKRGQAASRDSVAGGTLALGCAAGESLCRVHQRRTTRSRSRCHPHAPDRMCSTNERQRRPLVFGAVCPSPHSSS